MKLKITRDLISSKSCPGTLVITDADNNEVFSCYTLEEDTEASELKEDGTYVGGKDERLPEGVYKLRRHDTRDKNGKCVSRYAAKVESWTGVDAGPINVYNDKVPASRLILIHWGNTEDNTLGCMLLGDTRNGADFIGNSQDCCNRFYNVMNDVDLTTCELEIVNDFK